METNLNKSVEDQNLKLVETIVDINKKSYNEDSLQYPTFAKTLSTFQNLISKAEAEKQKLSQISINSNPSSNQSLKCENNSKTNIKNSSKSSVKNSETSIHLRKRNSIKKSTSSENTNKFKEIQRGSNSFRKKKNTSKNCLFEMKNKSEHIKKKNKVSFDEECTNLLRTKNSEIFINFVKMHLLMMLDLDGENFSNVFEEDNKKLNTIKKYKLETKIQDKNLFQQVLTEEGICRLYQLIDFIGKNSNIIQEGIFRKCGSTTRQQELKYKLQNKVVVDLESGQYTVHDCTNVLKTCLSEMPEPLLTEYFYKIIAQRLIKKENKILTEENFVKIFTNKKLKLIQLILLLLPNRKRKFAQDLLILLNRATLKENEKNKMNAKNLATLFAPHLLCPKTITAQELHNYVTILTTLLEYMILNVDVIFQTPLELLLDIRKELERLNKKNKDEDDGIHTVLTFCDRDINDSECNKLYTEQHIAELYAHIQNMPETPSKKKLIKQFNRQNGGLTPLIDKENSKKKSSKIKSLGDKIKNAKNIFKPNIVKNYPINKKDENNINLLKENKINENNSNKFKTLIDTTKNSMDIPIGDLTITKFCIDDDDDINDNTRNTVLLNQNKKFCLLGVSTNEIFIDVPFASESIIL